MKPRAAPSDWIAFVTIMGCFILIAVRRDVGSSVGTTLSSVIAFYFGRTSAKLDHANHDDEDASPKRKRP